MAASAESVARPPKALLSKKGLAYAPAMGLNPDDSVLMLRYPNGDISAFETLYRRHNDPLYRYLLRLCRHRDTAEDIFQDVWGKIIKAQTSYRPTAKFTTFLYRVAHNCFIDHVRRNKRHLAATGHEADLEPHPGESPETTTERDLAKRRLARALLQLPDEQRDVFLLREEAGLSLDEIAFVTGSSRETTKSRMRYAMIKLRTAIDERPEPI